MSKQVKRGTRDAYNDFPARLGLFFTNGSQRPSKTIRWAAHGGTGADTFSRLRYYYAMKTPPDNPEFARFTEAMRTIVKASKVEMNRRIAAAKKGKRSKDSASPVQAAPSTSAAS